MPQEQLSGLKKIWDEVRIPLAILGSIALGFVLNFIIYLLLTAKSSWFHCLYLLIFVIPRLWTSFGRNSRRRRWL